MVNRKQALRLGTFLAILMFLLVPLLSSPVAAAFTDNTNVTTDMTPAGPTIVINPTNNRVHFYDGLAPTATFTLTYSFSDTDPTGLGSWHTATITVTPPGAPTGFASTGALFLSTWCNSTCCLDWCIKSWSTYSSRSTRTNCMDSNNICICIRCGE